jgi:hypothetical protein
MLKRSTLALAGFALLAAVTGFAPATQPATQPATKAYPLDTCIVSDEKLGSMGKPIALVHEGQEVKFCCKGCVGEFKEDPTKYLKKLSKRAPATQPSH